MAVNNPRHPHVCRIYRKEGATNFSKGTEVVLYEGACRKEGSTNLRTFKTNNVLKCDYALSLPGIIEGIMSGDLIDVTDRQGEYKGCMVTDAYAGNLGTTVYFNHPKN